MKVRLKVREIAEERGYTAGRLGRKAGLSNAAMYSIWNGITTDPGINTLARIARAIGVKACDLFEVTEESVYDDRMSLLVA
jgi:transcriptional regulator with XRE-family HTH domain